MEDSGINGLKLNKELFKGFVKIIRNKSGLFFDLSKMYFLETKLKKRMKERGIKDFLTYLNLLETDYSNREFMELLNEITVHETSFFRINSQFIAFSDFVLSDLIARKQDVQSPYMSFLSAGCSTGEEAYSITISVFEKMRKSGLSLDFSVVGLDVSTSVIEKAREGLFSEREVSGLSEEILNRYFKVEGKFYRVKDFLSKKVFFKYANVCNGDDVCSLGRYDAVFCRYVLIYLDEVARKKVIENLYSILNPGGFLFVAPSESYNVSDKFARIEYKNTIVFMKPL